MYACMHVCRYGVLQSLKRSDETLGNCFSPSTFFLGFQWMELRSLACKPFYPLTHLTAQVSLSFVADLIVFMIILRGKLKTDVVWIRERVDGVRSRQRNERKGNLCGWKMGAGTGLYRGWGKEALLFHPTLWCFHDRCSHREDRRRLQASTRAEAFQGTRSREAGRKEYQLLS